MTSFMWIATCAWSLLVVGYFFRFRRRLHVPLMLAGIFCDIVLVLYLQVTREAIQTALGFSLAILKQIHIGFSTTALLLYFPVLFLGYKLVTNTASTKQRNLHIRLATAALVARTLGFVFMFSMWKH